VVFCIPVAGNAIIGAVQEFMKYVIIGNGVAGIAAAFTIRSREATADITVISGESDYFYSRTALMYSFMDRMSLRDLEPHERKIYDRQSIRRVRAWVVDLNASEHTIKLDSGEIVPYDRLLLSTGSVPRRPDWKGLEQAGEGVCHFVSLQDLENCEKLTRTSRQVVLVGGGLIGIELAECIVHHGRELTFLVREPWYWPVALGNEEGAMISAHIRRHGVNLLLNDEVAEVIAGSRGRVRAVRTTSGGEFPCQMLAIAIGVRPCIDWLARVSTPPAMGRGIIVDYDFSTSLPDVFAAGDCAETPIGVEQLWYSAKRQGELAGRSMLGDSIEYRPPVFYNSSKFFEIEYTTVGRVNDAPADAVNLYHRFPGRETSIRIVEHGGAVIGFNMLGSRWNHTILERWILERRSLKYVLSALHQAQFDVEFGRMSLESLSAVGAHA
jgi:NADPH-dependent 2,4-dienoyl-CoA reductase/sulfur reductase-like enzyme